MDCTAADGYHFSSTLETVGRSRHSARNGHRDNSDTNQWLHISRLEKEPAVDDGV